MFPTWGSITPTGLTTAQVAAAQAMVNGPPAINTQAYATALLQTECEGSAAGLDNLPAQIQSACAAAGFFQETKTQASAALFWNDPGTTIQPPGHWLQIADTAMTSQNSSLLQSARLTALLGESMNDAGIAAWGDKYIYNLWRPVTAIQDCGPGGTASGTVTWSADFTTCDTSWSITDRDPAASRITWPATRRSAGRRRRVLADFFGTDDISFASTSNYYCNGRHGQRSTRPIRSIVAAPSAAGPTTSAAPPRTAGVRQRRPAGRLLGRDNDLCPDERRLQHGDQHRVRQRQPADLPDHRNIRQLQPASAGPNGAEFSRVDGGIHTPFAVEDAVTVGDAIGRDIAVDAGLPNVVAEPSSLCGLHGLPLVLARLRRRRWTRSDEWSPEA